ncbi:unnamed protein product [Ilex paraguariensis]|uniref:Protein ZIP4 homolog n=1 Tax=Ilex paraguariensis TaxID=185542 RepID=A0ABC8U0H8_9AQUA
MSSIKAISQVQAMLPCPDFSLDFLSLSAHAAVACRALSVAVASLSHLLNFLSLGKSMPTTEVMVLRTLVTVLMQEPGNESDILKYDCLNLDLTASLGKAKLEDGNGIGLQIFSIKVYGEVEGNNVMVCKSLILTVSAMIADEKQRNATLLDTEVKQAIELPDRAGKILTLIAAGTRSGDDQITTLGVSASQGPRSNPEVATFCLNTCLSSLLASPLPDYQCVALVLRKRISVAAIHKGNTDDDVVYGAHKQAYRIMVGLKEGEYRSEEGKWLAMTAWNRAALSVRLGYIESAKKWMDIGLELAGKVPEMQTYR